ncbi:MAG TPA: DUF2087 domain-containing protein [Burkholderiaceae bacterium]|nr:DUF2087 domain-containing protein [Burkholderiaceae bacterium]
MTRTTLPFSAPDLSALARFLERTLADHHCTHGRLPGHVEMMNLLARSIGRRNLQVLQAEGTATAVPPPVGAGPPDAWFDGATPPPSTSDMPPQAIELTEHARKALQHFDGAGRLERWPPKLSIQRLALWVLWTRFDGRRVYTEAQVNGVLKAWHLYGDHATLRRELVDHRLMSRRSDCSEYRKLQVQPEPEVQALLQAVRALARQRGANAGRRSSRRPAPVAPAR